MTQRITRGETVAVPRGTVYQVLDRERNDAAVALQTANTATGATGRANSAVGTVTESDSTGDI